MKAGACGVEASPVSAELSQSELATYHYLPYLLHNAVESLAQSSSKVTRKRLCTRLPLGRPISVSEGARSY